MRLQQLADNQKARLNKKKSSYSESISLMKNDELVDVINELELVSLNLDMIGSTIMINCDKHTQTIVVIIKCC